MRLGKPTVLKVGKPAVPTATPTFGFGCQGSCFCTMESRRLVGITLPGNGEPVFGSRISLHLREVGLAWQIGELVGKMPVPALSSARLPAICDGDGYRPVAVLACRCRSPS